jgi:hypothetical protein
MKGYLSHFSSAIHWDIPYIEAIIGTEVTETDLVDITVSERCTGVDKKYRMHLCELNLPVGAVISRNGTMVASPELLFLQLANKLDIHRLILLGLQLCSHPPGNPSKAITSKQKLKTFLAKTTGHRGHRKALRAVKYLENGSASIMESIAYMILTLPHALGGYGLDGAVFNHEIILKDETGKRLGQKRCFMDLYYIAAKLAVEYDSFTFHNSPQEQGKDAIRSVILGRQGIEVIHLNTFQLYDKDACRDFALYLASRLGRRIQIRTKNFDKMHTILRTLLPAGKPVC